MGSSESPPVNAEGLDDWILRNFKTDSSPLAGSSPDPKSGGSTGYSSAGCESPDGDNGNPDSPNTMQENIKSLQSTGQQTIVLHHLIQALFQTVTLPQR